MMKHEEMITLIGDLFMDAYMAGQQTDMSSIQRARADRDRLLHEVRELYQELEHESYEREQNQVELMNANNEIANLRDRVSSLQEEIERRIEEKKAIFNGTPCLGMKNRLSEIYGSKLTDPSLLTEDVDFDPAPEDIEPELRDCLPFPDVEDLTPLLGGEE